ncbi:hypothetical protein NDU88_007423 [Pleurodeles waltl]|uniref:Uncharacterized protein n=1 Tax=Pleurodeles waltl TaxID=8319 RepID=A0AAV7NA57_PLEWA|nr:hypothetical protein NDU88_007423 [Pleurodeles waltl]
MLCIPGPEFRLLAFTRRGRLVCIRLATRVLWRSFGPRFEHNLELFHTADFGRVVYFYISRDILGWPHVIPYDLLDRFLGVTSLNDLTAVSFFPFTLSIRPWTMRLY